MLARLLLSLLSVVALAAEAACVSTVPSSSFQTPRAVSMTVEERPAGRIDAGFVGLSYEKSILSTRLFSPDNRALESLFRRLGPGILRIGGNSVNETLWDGSGRGLERGRTAPADVERLAGFLRATGWRVIYGLNGTTSPPARSAEEAAAVARILGSSLYDFEIGNEPDLYRHNGLEPPSFAFADFLSLWESYRSAILTQVPEARFSGPAAASAVRAYTLPFAEAARGRIELLTQHYYRANGRSVPPPTIDFLLRPDPKLPPMLAALKRAAVENRISLGYRIAEANSFYNGGAPGISDTFGSALWVLQFCFALVEGGAAGVNLHGGGDSTGYTPIANAPNGSISGVRPEYYGLYLFSRLEGGTLLTVSTKGQAGSVESHAVALPGGRIAVVLLDPERTTGSEVTVHLPSPYRTAELLALRAPGLDATSGITLDGVAITDKRDWAPRPSRTLPFQGKELSVRLPAASVDLLIFER